MKQNMPRRTGWLPTASHRQAPFRAETAPPRRPLPRSGNETRLSRGVNSPAVVVSLPLQLVYLTGCRGPAVSHRPGGRPRRPDAATGAVEPRGAPRHSGGETSECFRIRPNFRIGALSGCLGGSARYDATVTPRPVAHGFLRAAPPVFGKRDGCGFRSGINLTQDAGVIRETGRAKPFRVVERAPNREVSTGDLRPIGPFRVTGRAGNRHSEARCSGNEARTRRSGDETSAFGWRDDDFGCRDEADPADLG